MELVNSYLLQVGQHLPRDQRSDIIRELRDDITEQLDALAEQAGRSPDAADERAVLGRLGHPLKVASSYSSRRYLIGPGLYPAYLKTLRTSIGLVLASFLLFWVAMGSDNTGTYVLKGLLGQVLGISFWVAVIVTTVFLLLETSGDKLGWYHDWSPDQLKRGVSSVDTGDLVINLIAEGYFLLLWNGFVSFSWGADPQWLAGLDFSSIWADLFLPLNLTVGGLFGVHAVVLVQWVWQRWSACLELVFGVLLLGVLAILLLAGNLVTWNDTAPEETVVWADRTLRFAVVMVAVFTLWDSKLAYGRWRQPAFDE